MKPLSANEIKGNWVSLFLDIKDDDEIDYISLEKLIDYYIGCGVDGIYSNGTACEFYSQSFEEYKKINNLLAEKCEKSGMPFQIGASYMSARESLLRVRYAAKLKPSAIQVILPDWFPASRKTQINYLEKIVEAAEGIGIVLYNPPHAKVVLTPQDYIELFDNDGSIVGIKTAAGDEDWYRKMQPLLDKISVFVPGHFMATGIARGASGSYSNVAAINPRAAQKWYEITQTDIDKALELESRIQLFMQEYIEPFIAVKHHPNHACDKFMAAVGGWFDISTKLRWPYIGIDKKETERVRLAGNELIPEFFNAEGLN